MTEALLLLFNIVYGGGRTVCQTAACESLLFSICEERMSQDSSTVQYQPHSMRGGERILADLLKQVHPLQLCNR